MLIFTKTALALPLYITVDSKNIQDISDYEKDFLRKSTFEAIIQTKALEILHNGESANIHLPAGESYLSAFLNVGKNKSNKYDLDFELREIPSGNVVNKFSVYNVQKSKIQFVARRILFSLFFEEMKFKENLDESEFVINSNLQNSIKKLDAKNKKNSTNREKADQDKTLKVIPVDNTGESKVLIKKKEKEKEVEAEKKKETKKPNSTEISKFESPDLDLKKDAKNVVESNSFKLTFKNNFEYELGYEKQTTNARAYVDEEATLGTNTYITYLTIGLFSNVKIEEWEKYMTYSFLYKKVLSQNEYKLPANFEASLKYSQSLWRNIIWLNGGLSYDKYNFVSLLYRGDGLEKYTNSTLWLGGELLYVSSLFGEETSIGFGMYRSLVGSSDMTNLEKDIVVDGNKVEFVVKRKIWKNYGASFFYKKVEFTSLASNNFNTSHDVLTLNLTYN